MTKEQILKKAIEKAVKGGWDIFGITNHFTYDYKIIAEDRSSGFFDKYVVLETVDDLGNINTYTPREVLLDIDFAKAFWGYGLGICNICGERLISEDGKCMRERCNTDYDFAPECNTEGDEGWEHHLQQMVLEEDPIKYLEQFLEN